MVERMDHANNDAAAPPPSPPKRRFRLASRGALKRLAILFSLILLLLIYCYFAMIHMPGSSHRGPLPPLTDHVALASQRSAARRGLHSP